ncbi:MAG TPA: endospore germination permease [Clostridiales bacterium]|nr:endospore germination permease [Clostridiales bacterium]
MKLEKGTISNSQMAFLLGIYIQGSIFCTALVYHIMTRNICLISLTSFAVCLIFVFVFIKLIRMFPGHNLLDLNNIVFGVYVGKVVSGLYLLFLVILTVANLRLLSDYVVGNYMVETPILAIAIMFLFVLAWAVYAGLEVLARIGVLFFVIVSVLIGVIFLLSLSQMEITNFFPLFDISFIDFVRTNHIISTIFFGECFLFMMFIPCMKQQNRLGRSLLFGLIAGEISLILSVIMITGVLGDMASISNSPLNRVLRQVDLGQVLSRMEFIVTGILMFSVFMRIAVMYYAATMGLSQFLGLKSYRILVIPLGVVILGLVVPMFYTPSAQIACGISTWPFFASFFEFVLPVVTLFVALLRGLFKKREEECR